MCFIIFYANILCLFSFVFGVFLFTCENILPLSVEHLTRPSLLDMRNCITLNSPVLKRFIP